MGESLEQFVERLSASGLMSATEVLSFQDTLPPPKPRDAETLARELVRASKLTRYQAAAVYEGRIKGLVFGEYRVLDKLGQGGMGVVLKAEHRRMKRLVAVKMIAGAGMNSPEAVQRFYREVEAAAQLNHPNIVQAYDASEHEGVHYLVMEYVDGKDLAAIVKEKGRLPVVQAVECIVQAARGLHYAHEKGIVHRDIKPANLLLDKDGTVKILDMGLARLQVTGNRLPEEDRLTASGQVMGTCDYMAPEQARDTHHADRRADIYSLGCTLYRLVTGETPYQGESLVQILWAHQQGPIPSLCERRPEVTPELDAVYRRMMAKHPAERQASMVEVIADLERCLGKRAGAAQSLAEQSLSGDLALQEALSFLEEVGPSAASHGGKKTLPNEAETAEPPAGGREKEGKPHSAGTPNRRPSTSGHSRQAGSMSFLERLLLALRKRPLVSSAIAISLSGVLVALLAATLRVEPPAETKGEMPKQAEERGQAGEKVSTLSVQGLSERQELPKPFVDDKGNWKLPPGAPPPAIAPLDAKKARDHQDAWARYLAVPVEMTNSIGMIFRLIPPGEFDMGSTDEEVQRYLAEGQASGESAFYMKPTPAERPRHRVKIGWAFYLGVYEVTQTEYQRMMGSNPSSFASTGRAGPKVEGVNTARHPVESVSWLDADRFCKRLSALSEEAGAGRIYQLPTEAQWEYACRAGTATGWPCGDTSNGLAEHAWYRDNAKDVTHPVGQRQANGWGLFDMHGNVREWCQDWFGPEYYAQTPAVDPLGPTSGESRVLRGGAYAGTSRHCRTALRHSQASNQGNPFDGLRVACWLHTPAGEGSSRARGQ